MSPLEAIPSLLLLLLVMVVIGLPLAFILWARWDKWRDALQHARGRLKRMLTVGILVALLIIALGWLSWQWRALVAPAIWLLPLLVLSPSGSCPAST